MYNFIKSKKTSNSGDYEIIDHVEINGEILEVETIIDEHKYIICDLDKINQYINEEYFTYDIGFIIRYNNLPYYITDIFLTRESKDKYMIVVYVCFCYTQVSTWSAGFLGWNFEENFKKLISIKNKNIIICSSEEDSEGYYIELNTFVENLDSIYNSILQLINDIVNNYNTTVKQLDKYKEIITYNTYSIPVDKKLKTALKQYLIYFPEYIAKAKGEQIKFEITSDDEFLNINIDKDSDVELIHNYLLEYVNFTKKSIDNINPEIRSDLDINEQNILLVELRSQIRNFETTIEIKNVEIKLLNNNIDMLHHLLSDSIKNNSNNNITLNITSNSNLTASASNTILNITNELENLQNDIFDIKTLLPNSTLKEEINDIDNELMKLDESNSQNIKENKHIFKKIRRILEKFNDSNSDTNKILSQSKEVIKKIQSLAKTYNKFAQWLGLPVVPDVFIK